MLRGGGRNTKGKRYRHGLKIPIAIATKKVLLALLEPLGRKPGGKDQVFCSLHLSGTHHAHDLPRQFAWMPSTLV